MIIRRIQLTNFRRFAEAALEFQTGFNLFIGENGSGKTTILDALAVGTASWFLGVRGYDTKHIEPDEVRAVLRTHGETSTLERQFPVVVSCQGEVLGKEISWERSISGAGGRTTQTDAKSIKNLAADAEKRVRNGEEITLPVISYYGTKRLWVQPKDMQTNEDVQPGEFDERLQAYRFSIDQRINIASVLRWLRLEKFVALEEGKERLAFQAVKEAIALCIEGCVKVDYSVKEGALLLQFKKMPTLPFHLLSDGQRTMVAMVADLALKACQLNPHLGADAPKKSPGVVLIDELDLHLHPRWQRHVVKDLREAFQSIQFFATTHSPQIIGETPHEEIFLLTTDGTIEKPSQSVGLSSNQILKDLMGAEAINENMLAAFNRVFDLIEAGGFDEARQQIAGLRQGGQDYPELAEADSYMQAVESAAKEEGEA